MYINCILVQNVDSEQNASIAKNVEDITTLTEVDLPQIIDDIDALKVSQIIDSNLLWNELKMPFLECQQ